MLSLKQIEENPGLIAERLKIKNFDAKPLVDKILELNEDRKRLQVEADNKQAEMNRVSKEIGQLFKAGKKEEAEKARNATGELKEQIKALNEKQQEITVELENTLVQLPNLPSEKVPEGHSEADNAEVRAGGTVRPGGEDALPHWELAKKYDIIDFELGNKITGAGFPVYKGKGARLQRALINFFLDQNTAAGYHEVLPPLMVNEASGFGTGQLPDKEGQMYTVPQEHGNYYLIPTAEVPVTNIYRDVILNETDFPIKNTAYTPCFRREAGSYGKDVRGLNRLHQFDKVEIVQIQHPTKSYQALDEMADHV
ncbi:MAG: serine--tRNA ligase, partial [Bacteroidota bacterium]